MSSPLKMILIMEQKLLNTFTLQFQTLLLVTVVNTCQLNICESTTEVCMTVSLRVNI